MPQWLLLTTTFLLGMIAGAMLRGRREIPPARPLLETPPELDERVRELTAKRPASG